MPDKVRQYFGLSLAVMPGAAFIAGIIALRNSRFSAWWENPSLAPWQLWAIALTGTAALIASVGDWHFHTYTAKGKVSAIEERGEIIALGCGGAPMFFLMAAASLAKNPFPYLIPIVCVLIFTVAMICHDEFVFHRRRCGAYESFLHKVIVFGNGLSWLSWFSWIYARA